MQGFAVLTFLLAVVAIFLPVIGAFLAMLCSVFAMMAFRSAPALSGLIFVVNMVNTTFLSPVILLGSILIVFHLFLLFVAVIWRLILGAPKQAT